MVTTRNTFEMSQNKPLRSCLKQGIDAPYSVRAGFAAAVFVRVTSGTAEMTKNSILTDKRKCRRLILSCQAHPTSETIYVDYDDV
jgi:ring-1,2-phenylacetyl-CoA epoxidase subunit PaaE